MPTSARESTSEAALRSEPLPGTERERLSELTADEQPLASFDFDYFQSLFVESTIAPTLGTEIDLGVVDTSGSGPY